MMIVDFEVSIIKYLTIAAIPDAWTNADFKQLLQQLNIGEVSEIPANELKEMCQMALTDFEPNEAAKEVLTYLLQKELNEGQIDNLSHQMVEEPMWEEFADMRFHEALFNANQLLYVAYNGKFPRPEAVHLTIAVKATQAEGNAWLETPTKAFMLRLLAGGMDEHPTFLTLLTK